MRVSHLPRPTDIDVVRARHDPAFRQQLLASQLAQLSDELDRARTTTAEGVARIERMRAQTRLAVELATLIGRIQSHLRDQEDVDRAA